MAGSLEEAGDQGERGPVSVPVAGFILEFRSLRRLTIRAFGTLMSLEPAIAPLAGLLVLGQVPGTSSAVGIILVVVAGAGAARTGGRVPVPEDRSNEASPQHPSAPPPEAEPSVRALQ